MIHIVAAYFDMILVVVFVNSQFVSARNLVVLFVVVVVVMNSISVFEVFLMKVVNFQRKQTHSILSNLPMQMVRFF